MAKIAEPEISTMNLIGAGTDIKGDIQSSGDIRIDGTLKGNLRTKGKVVIGTTGLIKGEVYCKNSTVEGKVEGKINVQELIALKQTSIINGDISAKRLAIEPGAKFTGTCIMSSDSLSNEPQKTAPQEEPKKSN